MAADSPMQGDVLLSPPHAPFANLSEAENRLLQAAPRGLMAIGGQNSNDKDPANDPISADNQPKAGGWSGEREIRADLIRWLCTDQEAVKRVHAKGIAVYGARITGELDLSRATVPFPLSLSRCRLTSLCNLQYAKIPALYFGGSLLSSLSAVRAEVESDLFLHEGFSAQGEVTLVGARIGGTLVCIRGYFKNPGGNALSLGQAEIKGSVFLRDGFCADGAVNLGHTQIEGDLDCTRGRFGELDVGSARIHGIFVWRDIQGITELDLRGTTVGAIWDDEPSWPEKGKLQLDSFAYGSIGRGPSDAPTRLKWLDRQSKFTPQPYRQLAKVLHERGDDEGAKQVLFELESRARAVGRRQLIHAPARWFGFAEDTLSDATVGYGVYPERSVWFLCGLTALGWILYRRAQRVGAIAPSDKDAYKEFHENNGRAPDHYPPFSPLIYSLENCVPLIKFGIDDRWQPDPSPQQQVPKAAGPTTVSGRIAAAGNWLLDAIVPNWATSPAALRRFRWTVIGLGWLLATFFVAAITGLIKTGQ